MTKKIIIFLSVIFILLLAYVFINRDKILNRNAINVVVETVSEKNIVQSVTANGKIYPFKEVKLSLELPGEVTNIYINEGDSVSKGTLLLEIKADNYIASVSQSNAAYKQAQANLSAAKSRLNQANAQLLIVEKDYNRKKGLFSKKIISALEMESVETQYLAAKNEKESAEQNVKANNFQVQSALAGLDQTQDNLTRTKLYAPMSGIVSKLNVEKGEKVVGTASMAGTELVTISEFSELELKVEVGENEVLQIQEGDTALIEVDAYLGQEIKGIVNQVAYSSNALVEQQVSKFEVKIKLLPSSYQHLITTEAKLPFRPGMSATAEIITNTKKSVLSVPIQSVTLRDLNEDDEDDEKVQIVFLEKDGVIKLKEVKTGIQDDAYIEILSGIEKGEKVVSAPFKAISKELKVGDKVTIVSENELYEEK